MGALSRLTFAVIGAIAAAAVVRGAQPADGPYLVEVDAVVVDDSGRAVTGLRQDDFQIREDGRPVELKTFEAVADTGDAGRGGARSIVLLLDDSGIGTGNTFSIQSIARMFVSRMAPPDEFSVIRLNNRRDEAFGDRLEALMRISEYKADALPFFGRETVENALKVFAKVSRTLEAIEQRRKALVCIGVPAVCSMTVPASRNSLLWRYWVDAIGAMARSNSSLYSLEPNGVSGSAKFITDSIADASGGDVFRNTSDVTRVIDIVRRDTGNYYLLGYWPSGSKSELHSIEVKVNKRGLRVRARRYRGESS
ncbi:MAG TPA: VWA domain-containing protein [Vicinamibacterales bacterium]|nr:VWA domain-containing protein [Vicinamibacterales bacterium]